MATKSIRRVSKDHEPKVYYREITPAIAKAILERNQRLNRSMSERKLFEYAEAMKKPGGWRKHNSQGISVDWDGNLVNGFHRLTACIRSGKPFWTLFIEGVDPDVFLSEDSGTPRSGANVLQIAGEKNYIVLAGGARVMEYFDRGQWPSSTMTGGRPDRLITMDQLLACIERRPVLRKAAQYVKQNERLIGRRFTTSLACAMWALTYGHPKHERFWEELVHGVNSDRDSPARILRQRIDNLHLHGHRISRTKLLGLLTKAWNAYAMGVKVGKLGFSDRTKVFPEPITKLQPAHPIPKLEEAEAENKEPAGK